MDVVIIGAGGHGKVVLDALRCAKTYTAAGFLDANASLGTVAGLPVLGGINLLPKLKAQKVRGAIVAIGDNRARMSAAARVLEAGLELINVIHPSAIVSSTASLGRNIFIAARAVVCADAKLGDSVIINTGAIVEHECEIGAGAHVCPGAALAGRVRIGSAAFVGLSASVLPCLSVGDGAIIGAGATVIGDVAAGATVVGTPARAIRRAA